MESKPRSRKRILIAGFSVLLLIVVGLFALLYFRGRSRLAAVLTAPNIILDTPLAGESFRSGSYIPVVVTAFGQSPISRLELWLDGMLIETVSGENAMDQNPLSTTFDLLMTEGDHMLSARAIDSANLIGQSIPIYINGEPPIGEDEAMLIYTAEAGDTLEVIADGLEIPQETLQDLNPDLGNGGLLPDTQIIYPAPISGPTDESSAPPAASPPGAGSTIPGQTTPPLPPANEVKIIIASIIDFGPLLLPTAPSGLQVQVSDCKVLMTWNDNAANETHHLVWMQGLGQPAREIAKLDSSASTGPVWFQIKAPQLGFYSFWVEAVNSYGTQPSEVVWVAVPYDNSCPPGLATELELEITDIQVDGPYTNFYCYISVEGYPEIRLPADDSTFIRIGGGVGKLGDLPPGDKVFRFPIPGDDALDLGGECWGWIGTGDLQKIGSFNISFSSDQWDGRRLILTGSPFWIGFVVQTLGDNPEGGVVLYSYNDPTIPAPASIVVEEVPSGGIPFPYTTLNLRWVWDPPPNFTRGTGFTIFLNGNPVKQVGKDLWRTTIQVPGLCGHGIFRIQVAANAGEAQSSLSAPAQFVMPDCQLFARVQFIKIAFREVDDGESFPFMDFTPCDTFEAYYQLRVNATGNPNIVREYWGGNFFQPITCGGYYYFKAMSGRTFNWEDTIIVPLLPSYGSSGGDVGISFGIKMWDFDALSADDMVANVWETVVMPKADWQGYQKVFELFHIEDDGYGGLTIEVTAFEGLYIP